MPDILDDVKAIPYDQWHQNTSQQLVDLYFNSISYDDFDDLQSFVNNNFLDPNTGQNLQYGVDDVWKHYLKNGKDPSGPDSSDWRIYNEFEDSTSRMGVFLGQLMEDVKTKFWHNPNQSLTQDEELKLGHVCGILAIQAAYKNGLLYTVIQKDLTPSVLHKLEGGISPASVSTPVDPPPISLDEVLCTYLTPLGQDEFHAVVNENQDAQDQYQQLVLSASDDFNNDVSSAATQTTDRNQIYSNIGLAVQQSAANHYSDLSIVPGYKETYEDAWVAARLHALAAEHGVTSIAESEHIFINLMDDGRVEIIRKALGEDSPGESSDSGTDDPEHEDSNNESETDGEQEHSAGGAGHVH